MKNYIKPTIDFVKLESEERFAVGSVCTEVGACGFTDGKGVFHQISYYVGLNG